MLSIVYIWSVESILLWLSIRLLVYLLQLILKTTNGLYLDALDFGITEESRRARTGESVDSLSGANGVGATGVGTARVWSFNALVVLAHKAGVAVGINLKMHIR